MQTLPVHDEREWPYVLTLLPLDLEDSARESEALVRCRNVPDAAALMRMALAYAVSDLSLKDVAAWANALGLAQITGPGLFYRLREAEAWLQRVLAQTLQNHVEAAAESRMRLRVVDATVLHGPGATGTEWRAHVLIDPGTGGFRAVELTDAHGGEGYGRYRVAAHEVILGDRAYATARGLWAIQSAQAYVVARMNPHTIRVCDETRQRISLRSQEKRVPKVGGVELNIIVPIPPEKRTKSHKGWPLARAIAWVPARAVAARTRLGEVIWLLTTLSAEQASPHELMQLYRLRWQIELFFKRLKSLLPMDALPSRQGPTAKSWMLARFLAAALAQELVQPAGPLSPWGYELRSSRLHA
ncbi:MAG: IS4 family transposase [Terriglobia bacterium]